MSRHAGQARPDAAISSGTFQIRARRATAAAAAAAAAAAEEAEAAAADAAAAAISVGERQEDVNELLSLPNELKRLIWELLRPVPDQRALASTCKGIVGFAQRFRSSLRLVTADKITVALKTGSMQDVKCIVHGEEAIQQLIRHCHTDAQLERLVWVARMHRFRDDRFRDASLDVSKFFSSAEARLRLSKLVTLVLTAPTDLVKTDMEALVQCCKNLKHTSINIFHHSVDAATLAPLQNLPSLSSLDLKAGRMEYYENDLPAIRLEHVTSLHLALILQHTDNAFFVALGTWLSNIRKLERLTLDIANSVYRHKPHSIRVKDRMPELFGKFPERLRILTVLGCELPPLTMAPPCAQNLTSLRFPSATLDASLISLLSPALPKLEVLEVAVQRDQDVHVPWVLMFA